MRRFSYRTRIDPYPYRGRFYRERPQYDLPLLERGMDALLLYESQCDIQEVSKANNPTLIATFSVFMPFDVERELPFTRGSYFEGSMNGMDVSGLVTNVVLSQLGGIVAYVKDYDSE